MSAFMVPQYDQGIFWEIESKYGEGTLVPGDLVGSDPSLEDFKDYIEGDPASFERVEGWFARLSAPGYMDATEWSGPFDTEKDSREDIEKCWEVDGKRYKYPQQLSSACRLRVGTVTMIPYRYDPGV